ncbi:MAG: DegV family protein [Chloroflexi bacterium]|nr:DegV family protein [Chloroflexota bacterium]
MARIIVVTDSSACVPAHMVRRYDIRVAPVHLIFGERDYRDGIDLTPTEFYQMLRQAERLPTTSAPSVGEYLQIYEEARSQGAPGIVCVATSSTFSHIYESAGQAAMLLSDIPIRVIDSRMGAAAVGLVALAAARRAYNGGSLEEVVKVVQRAMARVRTLIALDTLEYLQKSGRVPAVAVWATNLLNIKPILTIVDGQAKVLRRTRARRRAVEHLLEIMRLQAGQGGRLQVAVMHADVLAEAEALKETVAEQFRCAKLFLTEFTPAMGVHTGPGVLGLAFLPLEDDSLPGEGAL